MYERGGWLEISLVRKVVPGYNKMAGVDPNYVLFVSSNLDRVIPSEKNG